MGIMSTSYYPCGIDTLLIVEDMFDTCQCPTLTLIHVITFNYAIYFPSNYRCQHVSVHTCQFFIGTYCLCSTDQGNVVIFNHFYFLKLSHCLVSMLCLVFVLCLCFVAYLPHPIDILLSTVMAFVGQWVWSVCFIWLKKEAAEGIERKDVVGWQVSSQNPWQCYGSQRHCSKSQEIGNFTPHTHLLYLNESHCLFILK
jgi:hypothetical protein